MSFLLDTCVLSELVRPRPTTSVLAWLEAQDEGALFVSVLTLGELHKGIAKLAHGSRKKLLSDWVQGALVPRFGPRLLPVDNAVAAAWGEISGEHERAGTPLPVIDSLIAATARVHGLTVVTRNAKHFRQCDATVIDPWIGG